MPKYIGNSGEEVVMWNFYINKTEKIKFITNLAKNGLFRAQGAALRTLMFLYNNDKYVEELVNEKIKDFLVYKKDDNISMK